MENRTCIQIKKKKCCLKQFFLNILSERFFNRNECEIAQQRKSGVNVLM